MFGLFKNKIVLKKQELIENQFLIHGPEYLDLKEIVKLYEFTPIEFNIPEFNPNIINKKLENDLESQALSCYAVFNKNINYFNNFYKINKWAITKKINVYIRAGLDLNAYYCRNSFKFFYGPHKNKQKMVYSVDYPEIISHELGHGLLDSIRPDLWNVQSMEIWAFHESFADIIAMVYLLQFDSVIEKMLNETNGNLEKTNLVSRLAEGFENSISNNNYLRDASIQNQYEQPEILYLKNKKYNKHEFSKIFTSAWYKIFVQIFKKISGVTQIEAVKLARDISFKYLIFSTKMAPNNIRFFETIANLMLIADKNNNCEYQEIIKNVFKEQNIIKEKVMFLSSDNNNKKIFRIKDNKLEYTYSNSENYEVVLSEKLILGQNNNNLLNKKIELASENISIKTNDLNVDLFSSKEDVLNSALCCLNYINDNYQGWEIKNNKLIRTEINCF